MSMVLPPLPELFPVPGLRLGIAQAHIRKPNRDDVVVMVLQEGSHAAGVFTQNKFCAAPVLVCREHLIKTTAIRSLVINTGCANATTGEQGLQDAQRTAHYTAQLLEFTPESVLPFSTGVIMERLPIDRLEAGIKQCIEGLQEDNWARAASAIMTTDTCPKGASKRFELSGKTVTVTGISKGSGMIHPNMATMLGYLATDIPIAPALLQEWTKRIADASFNRITVDGDTSTNDSFILMSTGAAQIEVISSDKDPRAAEVFAVLESLSIHLAQAIIRDGEGATKFITISVEGANDSQEAVKIAKSIAHSPLVKTAFFASDPNLGRIAAAIGYADVNELNSNDIDVFLDDVHVIRDGGRASEYQEADGKRVMKQQDITIRVVLKKRGDVSATVWTCDFSHQYVTINAEYRS
ncbi:MAG: bifunctional glutamate N-acetyltransferase/amino-acid acetyltransferase ArgJ [Pseudomonadota bacterium]